MPSAPAIRLELKPSRWQRALVATLLMAASISLLAAPWPLWLRIPALSLLGLLAGWQWQRRRRLGRPDLIVWQGDGTWWLSWPGRSRPVPARLRQARVVGPLLALELVEIPAPDGMPPADYGCGRHLALSLWPDSADPDQLRRLRIRLQREGGPGDGATEGAAGG